MSLLDELVGAELVVVDQERRIVFAWFGGAGVNIYDEAGRETDSFTVGTRDGRRPTPAMVRAAIERVRAEYDHEEE